MHVFKSLENVCFGRYHDGLMVDRFIAPNFPHSADETIPSPTMKIQVHLHLVYFSIGGEDESPTGSTFKWAFARFPSSFIHDLRGRKCKGERKPLTMDEATVSL